KLQRPGEKLGCIVVPLKIGKPVSDHRQEPDLGGNITVLHRPEECGSDESFSLCGVAFQKGDNPQFTRSTGLPERIMQLASSLQSLFPVLSAGRQIYIQVRITLCGQGKQAQ